MASDLCFPFLKESGFAGGACNSYNTEMIFLPLLQLYFERTLCGQNKSWSFWEGKSSITLKQVSAHTAMCGNVHLFFTSQVYGGYVTSLLVSGEDSPVKCGAVLSPITDFQLYGKLCASFSSPPSQNNVERKSHSRHSASRDC